MAGQTADVIFRNYVTDGIPESGPHNPKKGEIRSWGTNLEAGIFGGASGAAVFVLVSQLNAALNYAANSMAWVIGDPVPANNGIYRKNLGSGSGNWTRVADLPFEFIKTSNVGAGTANAIVATSDLPIPEADGEALIALPIFTANTATPVTVAINGADALTIKTNSGNDIAIGGLTAGMIVAGYKSGTTFRLLSDQASAAIQIAAEDAAALAQAWAEGTLPGGVGTKSAKEWAEEAGSIALGIAPVSGTGDGVTTTLTLPIAPGFATNVRIAIDGVAQEPGSAYTTSGTTLTWAVAPHEGAAIFGFIISATEVEIGVPDAGSVGAAAIDPTEGDEIVAAIGGGAFYGLCQGRLTLSTGVPVTSADVTAASSVYFTPYLGNQVWLHDGSIWRRHSLVELSFALSGGTASKPHDVFLDYNSGTPQLALAAWTNDTTRATALALQNGILVKSGATGQRYLGTIYLDASKQCADSLAKRHVWNLYNRRQRPMRVVEATSDWSYSTAAWRQARASAANQLDFVRGLDEDCVVANLTASTTSSTSTLRKVSVAIGLDSTSSPASGCIRSNAYTYSQEYTPHHADWSGLPGLGRHVLTWLEYGAGTDSQTWYGVETTLLQSGLIASVHG